MKRARQRRRPPREWVEVIVDAVNPNAVARGLLLPFSAAEIVKFTPFRDPTGPDDLTGGVFELRWKL